MARNLPFATGTPPGNMSVVLPTTASTVTLLPNPHGEPIAIAVYEGLAAEEHVALHGDIITRNAQSNTSKWYQETKRREALENEAEGLLPPKRNNLDGDCLSVGNATKHALAGEYSFDKAYNSYTCTLKMALSTPPQPLPHRYGKHPPKYAFCTPN